MNIEELRGILKTECQAIKKHSNKQRLGDFAIHFFYISLFIVVFMLTTFFNIQKPEVSPFEVDEQKLIENWPPNKLDNVLPVSTNNLPEIIVILDRNNNEQISL